MTHIIVGPVLKQLEEIGLATGPIYLATAFYSERALSSLRISSDSVTVCCRMDFDSVDEWVAGFVAPEAMLAFLRKHEARGARVLLYGSPSAHAKVYVGDRGALVGSANLTLQGFGGGLEILALHVGRSELNRFLRAVRAYCGILDRVSLDELEEYVERHRRAVARRRARRPRLDTLPRVSRNARKHLGSYHDFLEWLDSQASYGAGEIRARAMGKANLSGHIHRNFYGLRQFLIAYPEVMTSMAGRDPDAYKLSKDREMERLILEFVSGHAADEPEFSVDVWKTYLPRECGGRAGRHGGTIGNLNYMLPLVASYLSFRLGSRRRRT